MLTPDLQQEVLNNIAFDAKENGSTYNELTIRNISAISNAFSAVRNSTVFPRTVQLSTVNAAAFITSALNSIVVKDIFNKGIDDFFNAPDTAPIFADMTAEEKEESRRQLKNTVAERLNINPETNKGRLFANMLEQQFNDYMANNEGERTEVRRNFMEKVLAPAIPMLEQIHKKFTVPAPDELKRQFNDPIQQFIIDNIAENAMEFSAEEGAIHCTINKTFMTITRDSSVTPASFLEHYKAGTLSDEEKEWAVEIFDNAHIEHTPDYASFMKNLGNTEGVRSLSEPPAPLFTEEELEQLRNDPEFEKNLKIKAIGTALSGTKVSEKNAANGTVELLNPVIEDLRRSNRSVWEAIIDFFKDLLGIGKEENRQLKEIMENSKKNAEKLDGRSESPKSRDHISYKQITGEDAIDRVTVKPVEIRQPTISKEIAAPSRHK